jgi:hypothetical protein
MGEECGLNKELNRLGYMDDKLSDPLLEFGSPQKKVLAWLHQPIHSLMDNLPSLSWEVAPYNLDDLLDDLNTDLFEYQR